MTSNVASHIRRVGVALGLLAAAACDRGGDSISGPAAVASVAVAPDARALTVGETALLTATPQAANGGALAGRRVAWSVNDATVATVDSTGRVTALAAGTALVSATSEGKVGRATVTVSPVPVAEVALSSATLSLVAGSSVQVQATPRDAQGRVLAGRQVTWASENGAVATVVGGTITAVAPGATRVVATSEGRSAAVEVTVTAPPPAASDFDLLYDEPTGNLRESQLWRVALGGAGTPARVAELFSISDASPSPDGSRIAITVAGGGHSVISVINRDGTGYVRLTDAAGNADQPAWSPDGSRIAYRAWAAGGPPGVFNPAAIWVMNADGTGRTKLTEGAAGTSQQHPTWSPVQADLTFRIAYAHLTRADDGTMRGTIYSMRDDGGDKRVVTESGDGVDDQPSWSPTGEWIVFQRTGPCCTGQLFLTRVATGALRPLMGSDPDGAQHTPAWSPDGLLIAFTSNHEIEGTTYDYQVYTVRVEGTGLTRHTSLGDDKFNPAWIRRP